MPVSDHLRRVMLETIADSINEVVVGFDGTPSTSQDGAAGRPAVVLNPTVRVTSDSTILVEAFIPTTHSFDDTLKEVFVQFRGSTSIPVARHTIAPVYKTQNNEMRIQIIIEVK